VKRVLILNAGSSTLKSTRQPLSNLVLRDVGVEFVVFRGEVGESARGQARDDEGEARIGYAVPRRVGNAVERNSVKRRLREAMARHAASLSPATDYVVIARPGIAGTADARGFDWLCDQVAELLRSAEAAR